MLSFEFAFYIPVKYIPGKSEVGGLFTPLVGPTPARVILVQRGSASLKEK